MKPQEQKSIQFNQSNMNIAQTEFSEGFENEGEGSDWALCNEHAQFTHQSACEFIFYIGGPDEGSTPYQEKLEKLKELGFSEMFLAEVKEAQGNGFNYICFYA